MHKSKKNPRILIWGTKMSPIFLIFSTNFPHFLPKFPHLHQYFLIFSYFFFIDGISSANLECVFTHCRQCKSHLLTITEVRLRFRYSLLLASFDSETVRSWQSWFPQNLVSWYDVTGSQFTGLVGLLSRSVHTSVTPPPSYCVMGTTPLPPPWAGKGGT